MSNRLPFPSTPVPFRSSTIAFPSPPQLSRVWLHRSGCNFVGGFSDILSFHRKYCWLVSLRGWSNVGVFTPVGYYLQSSGRILSTCSQLHHLAGQNRRPGHVLIHLTLDAILSLVGRRLSDHVWASSLVLPTVPRRRLRPPLSQPMLELR